MTEHASTQANSAKVAAEIRTSPNVSRPEFELIDWIRDHVKPNGRVPLGIGDDAASLGMLDSDVLVATDMLMEGVHFAFPEATPLRAGRKSLAVNLSDIAAMAGQPIAAFVAVCFPKTRGPSFAREVMAGIESLAEEFDVQIAGGDTNSWDGPLVISVTVVGLATGGRAVTRSGAKPGDQLFVTGTLGGSIAGKHLDFTPRVREALHLHAAVDLHAMIDLSDGLSSDIHHILNASQVGAVIEANCIPISSNTTPTEQKSALDRALSDGEDFELLFAVSDSDADKLAAQSPSDMELTRIGIVTADQRCQLRSADQQLRDLAPSGWCHSL